MGLFNKGDIIERAAGDKFGTVYPGDQVRVLSCRGIILKIEDDPEYTYDASLFKLVTSASQFNEGDILTCTIGNARFNRHQQYKIVSVSDTHPKLLLRGIDDRQMLWWISDNLKDEDDLDSDRDKAGIAEFEVVKPVTVPEINIGHAVEHAKAGNKFTRKGWNGADQFVYYVPAASYPAQRNANNVMSGIFENDLVPYNHYLAIKTAQGTVSPWSPSGSDALATDFILL